MPQSVPEHDRRLWRYADALALLRRSDTCTRQGLTAACHEITRLAAEAMPAGRAGIWLFDDDHAAIRPASIFVAATGAHTEMPAIHRADFPAYFAAIAGDRVVAARDAQSDPQTAEFRDGYLVPDGITALLDAPIRVAGRLVGIVCHEHIGPLRHWDELEKLFACWLADHVALCLEANRRHQDSSALRRSETTRLALQDALPDTVLRFELTGAIRDYRPDALFAAVLPPERAAGAALADLFAPGAAAALIRCARECLDHRALAITELQCESGTGLRTYEARLVPCGGSEAIAVLRDVTEHRRMRLQSETRRRQLQEILDGLPSEVWVLDPSAAVVLANAPALRQRGVALGAVVGMPWPRLLRGLTDADATRLEGDCLDVAQWGRPRLGIVLASAGSEGERRHLSIDLVPLRAQRETSCVMAVVNDVTALRRTEDQLLHSQRLDALGRLAGGIAHDLGNVLTTVRGFTQLVAAELAPDATAHADLRQVEQGVQRAAELTRSLLTFARREPGTPSTFAINDTLLKQERMLQRVLGETIALSLCLDADAPHVRLDAGQFEQVVINLVLNARDAMPRGGRLTLATRLVRPTPVDALWCELEVADDGCGMSPEVQQHLFEPFFTTKPAGQGTGLGLAACYGIVRQAGGTIEVDSAPGRGSRFRVRLPAAVARNRGEVGADLAALLPRGSERIVLVEDDSDVRRTTARVLGGLGYEVEAVDNPMRALPIDDEPGLLVTDVVMPNLSGPDLAGMLRRKWPRLRVLFLSGYDTGALEQTALQQPHTAFLAKPFGPLDLALAVRHLLGAASC